VAIAYAARHSGNVAGLVIIGTPGKMGPAQASKIVASLKGEKDDIVMNGVYEKTIDKCKADYRGNGNGGHE
jgi:pimeloyl-ACP methyl ester carboxylesterase